MKKNYIAPVSEVEALEEMSMIAESIPTGDTGKFDSRDEVETLEW